MISEEQQRAIDVRRQYVARYALRGMTLREIHANLAAMVATDPTTGQKVPVCRNPDTGQPWSMSTIGEDSLAVKAGWVAGVAREVETRKAEVDAHLAEVRRLAYAVGDVRAVLLALKRECELFGLDAPKKSEIAVENVGAGVAANTDDPVPDAPALLALVASRNVAEVNFAAAWMPRRPVPVGKLTPALLRRYFGK